MAWASRCTTPVLLLPRFVGFMEERQAQYITARLALEWVQQAQTVQPAERARRLGFVRGFARYRSATDAPNRGSAVGAAAPPIDSRQALPVHASRKCSACWMRRCKLPTTWPSTPLRPWVFHCLLGLLSVTGLRISEALDLKLDDVDLDQGVLTIRAAKLGRSRLVPIHPSTMRRAGRLPCSVANSSWVSAASAYVFVSTRGTRLDIGRVHRAFYALSRQIGPACARREQGPQAARLPTSLRRPDAHPLVRVRRRPARRCRCCRPTSVTSTWRGTYWYLSAWPELMAQAMARLERRWGEPS